MGQTGPDSELDLNTLKCSDVHTEPRLAANTHTRVHSVLLR